MYHGKNVLNIDKKTFTNAQSRILNLLKGIRFLIWLRASDYKKVIG